MQGRSNKMGFGPKLKTLGLVLCLSLLGGCAFKRFFYDKLDWVIMLQLDRYLDLNTQQEDKLRPHIKSAVTWVKQEKLPLLLTRVDTVLEEVKARRYNRSITADLFGFFDGVRAELVEKYKPQTLELFQSLTEAQIVHLATKIKDANEKLEDVLEARDPEKAYIKTLSKQQDNLEEWYGDLTDAQEAMLVKHLKQTKPEIENRLKQRLRMQAFIMDILRTKDKAKMEAGLAVFARTGEIWEDPEYVAYRQTNEKRWEAFLAEFHPTLTPAQWQTLEKKIVEMKNDLLTMQKS